MDERTQEVCSLSVFNVAAEFAKFAKLSGWARSNLELQKLYYLSQLLHLGEKKAPLFYERLEAWGYGPVCPNFTIG